MIDGSVVVRLVTGHCLRRTLLVDQGAVPGRSGGSIGCAGLDARSTLDGTGIEARIDRSG